MSKLGANLCDQFGELPRYDLLDDGWQFFPQRADSGALKVPGLAASVRTEQPVRHGQGKAFIAVLAVSPLDV